MRCSSTDNGLPAGCRCSGTTVFDGATIGQVFTGHVEITCPVATDILRRAENDTKPRAGNGPLATALLTVAIWQAWLALPTSGSTPSSHALHALLFLAGGASARYLTPAAIKSWVRGLLTGGARTNGRTRSSEQLPQLKDQGQKSRRALGKRGR